METYKWSDILDQVDNTLDQATLLQQIARALVTIAWMQELQTKLQYTIHSEDGDGFEFEIDDTVE